MNVKDILDQKWVIPAAVGVVGVASGFAGGYFLGKRNGATTIIQTNRAFNNPDLEELYEETTSEAYSEGDEEDVAVSPAEDPEFLALLREEEAIEDAVRRERLRNIVVEHDMGDEPSTDEVFDEPALTPPEENDAEPSVQRVSVFDSVSDVDIDEEAEAEKQQAGVSYIITVQDYVEGANNWTQETLTYYAGDDTIATESNKAIYNHADLLGELKFGYGSNDRNTVYIRNESMRMEWEVLRVSGRYEVEVLGHTIEQEYEEKDLKHSNDRKFRDD